MSIQKGTAQEDMIRRILDFIRIVDTNNYYITMISEKEIKNREYVMEIHYTTDIKCDIPFIL